MSTSRDKKHNPENSLTINPDYSVYQGAAGIVIFDYDEPSAWIECDEGMVMAIER